MTEAKIYEHIARYINKYHPSIPYRFDLAADMKLTPGQAARHKRLHPRRGHPDLTIYYPVVDAERVLVSAGLVLEIKKDGEHLQTKDGSWSRKNGDHIAEQAAYLQDLRELGYMAEFGVGLDECLNIIERYISGHDAFTEDDNDGEEIF